MFTLWPSYSLPTLWTDFPLLNILFFITLWYFFFFKSSWVRQWCWQRLISTWYLYSNNRRKFLSDIVCRNMFYFLDFVCWLKHNPIIIAKWLLKWKKKSFSVLAGFDCFIKMYQKNKPKVKIKLCMLPGKIIIFFLFHTFINKRIIITTLEK